MLTALEISPWARMIFIEQLKRKPVATELAEYIIAVQMRGADFNALETLAVECESYRAAAAIVKERKTVELPN